MFIKQQLFHIKLFILFYIVGALLTPQVFAQVTVDTQTGTAGAGVRAGTETQTRTSAPNTSAASNNTSIFKAASPTGKKCPYIGQQLYKPFSNISTDFALFQAFEFSRGNGSAQNECIKIVGSVDRFVFLIFKIFVGITSVLAVIYIAVAGIKMIVEEANVLKKIKAKAMLLNAIEGLLLSLVAWVILFTLNEKLTKFSFNEIVTNTGIDETRQKLATTAGKENVFVIGGDIPAPTDFINGGTGIGNPYRDTILSDGSFKSSHTTIFGYKDGNGKTGFLGDNGIGNGRVSHVPGYTNYTYDTRSEGVAVPISWLIRDFGGVSNAKNSGYALFENGRSLGVFPIVDTSYSKLDLTFGLVRWNIDSSVVNSNSWSSNNISYKPMPGFFETNPRPSNPMIEDIPGIGNKDPEDVWAKVQNGTYKVIMK